MKKNALRNYGIVRTAVYAVLTALVLAFASEIAEIETLRYFIGGLMIFYGVEEIVYTVFKNSKHYAIGSLYWNIVEIIIGVTLIVFIETGEENVTYTLVCVSWAIWSILRESRELVDATEDLKNKLISCKIVAIFNLLESLAVIALSLTMLIEPGEHHATIHLYLLAVELFTKVLFPFINYIAEHVAEKKKPAILEIEQPAESEPPVGEVASPETEEINAPEIEQPVPPETEHPEEEIKTDETQNQQH